MVLRRFLASASAVVLGASTLIAVGALPASAQIDDLVTGVAWSSARPNNVQVRVAGFTAHGASGGGCNDVGGGKGTTVTGLLSGIADDTEFVAYGGEPGEDCQNGGTGGTSSDPNGTYKGGDGGEGASALSSGGGGGAATTVYQMNGGPADQLIFAAGGGAAGGEADSIDGGAGGAGPATPSADPLGHSGSAGEAPSGGTPGSGGTAAGAAGWTAGIDGGDASCPGGVPCGAGGGGGAGSAGGTAAAAGVSTDIGQAASGGGGAAGTSAVALGLTNVAYNESPMDQGEASVEYLDITGGGVNNAVTTEGTSYTGQFTIDTATTWSSAAWSLVPSGLDPDQQPPSGMGIDSSFGNITGTVPAATPAGTHTFWVRVTAQNSEMSSPFNSLSFTTDKLVTMQLTSSPSAAPTVTSVAPPNGDSLGGTLITVKGTGFQGGSTVSVGGSNCAPVNVVSATELTCITGAHAAGTVDVTVTVAGQSGTLTNGFTYVDPAAATITGVFPPLGTVAGGVEVTVTGTGFVGGLVKVDFDLVYCTDLVVLSSTQLTCKTPAHAAGAVDVGVTNLGYGGDTLSDAFTYVAPVVATVTAVSPSGGPTTGGTLLTITGTNFQGGASVTVGGAPCTPVTWVSSTELTCPSPAHAAGPVDVAVTNLGVSAGNLANAFTYLADDHPATVLAITPASGLTLGGTEVTITGSGFEPGAAVTLGGTACAPVNVVSSSQLTCRTGQHVAGKVDVVVTNPGVSAGVLADGFTYLGATCSLAVTGARPTGQELPLARWVKLLKATTNPECSLQFATKTKSLRGDVRTGIKVKVNKRTGKVTAKAFSTDMRVKVTVRAVPKKNTLYGKASKKWKRTWHS